MTDREIIETILEQKGNDLRKRLIEYINQVNFHDYDKDKKYIYVQEQRMKKTTTILLSVALYWQKRLMTFGLSLTMKECHPQISSLDMDYCTNTLT